MADGPVAKLNRDFLEWVQKCIEAKPNEPLNFEQKLKEYNRVLQDVPSTSGTETATEKRTVLKIRRSPRLASPQALQTPPKQVPERPTNLVRLWNQQRC